MSDDPVDATPSVEEPSDNGQDDTGLEPTDSPEVAGDIVNDAVGTAAGETEALSAPSAVSAAVVEDSVVAEVVEPLPDVRPPSVRSTGSAASSSARVQSPKSSSELPPVVASRTGSQSSVSRSRTGGSQHGTPRSATRSTAAAGSELPSPKPASPVAAAASGSRTGSREPSRAASRDVSREASRQASRQPSAAASREGSRAGSRPASARQEVRFQDPAGDDDDEGGAAEGAGAIDRDSSALQRSLDAVKSASSLFDDDEYTSSDEGAERSDDDDAAASSDAPKRLGTAYSQASYSVDDNADRYSVGTSSYYGGGGGGKRASTNGSVSAAGDTEEDQTARLGDARNVVLKRLQDAHEEQRRLMAANDVLQATVAKYFRVNKIDTKDQLGQPDTKNPALTDEERVELQMKMVHDKSEDLKTLRMYYDELTQEMKKRLEEKESKAQEVSTLFLKFKREIAREAEDSKTGKTISPQLIEHYEQEEIKKDAEVEKVRLKNITLRKKYSSLEKSLRQKEELKNGLHLIDFEQLKIENQTFNEKIEERNEELAKMRKKITNTVHILSHVKEKLQFLQVQNATLRYKLEQADVQMVEMRDRVGQMKQQRDSMRAENNDLRQRSGLIGNDDLLRDYQRRFDELQAAKEQLKSLQEENQRLAEKTARLLKSAGSTGKSPALAGGTRNFASTGAKFATSVV